MRVIENIWCVRRSVFAGRVFTLLSVIICLIYYMWPYFSFRCPVSHRARSPTAARRGATLQAKQHLPYVPGEPSTNIRVHLCVFYLRFWACVRRVCRVSPLHASIGEVHNLNTRSESKKLKRKNSPSLTLNRFWGG